MVIDHPSVGGMGATPAATRKVVSNRNYKVAHQKVAIDVDLEENSIKGSTDIIVIPSDPSLKFVKLDCRGISITNILVNQRRANYLYIDPSRDEFEEFTHKYTDAKRPFYDNINQHHLYKNRFKKMNSGESTDELTVVMPDKLKLSLHDPSQVNHLTPNFKDSPKSHKTSAATEMIYTPVTISIEYTLNNPKNGVHFVGGKYTSLNKNDWHAYTTNSALGVSTSSWVPCIDNLWEKSTWEVEISVPQTIRDIGVSKIIGSNFTKTIEEEQDEEDEDNEYITVIGGDFSNQKETAHPIDLAKKVVSFSIFNPTAAHHIGWAVGPFVHSLLLNLKEEDEPEGSEEKDTTTIPSSIYYLPSQEKNAINTTIFLYKAIDFYSREFGSFPFTSNALVFVSDMDAQYSGFSGLTVASKRLLYSPNEIEPIYSSTYALSVALSEQWSTINVTPRTYNDIWVTLGIAHYMALQFIRKLMGVNEYKYRTKKQADEVCNEDVGKRALADPFLKYPISVHDFKFLELKAPIVLFILDRRMTKTDKSFGLSRVIPKIFLQAMSGDLPNGCLSTYHFQHVCEKVNHNRLDSFFKQWVYGSGVPIFRVTQRFNKKRMFIEMGIRQVQQKEAHEGHHPQPETLIDEARDLLGSSNNSSHAPTLFTGPMTIRIHEADGTPYEHIVDLKEGFTKLDIQYNTKYKRLKRSQKQIKSEKEAREAAEEDDNVLLHCLGDILQTEKDINDWSLTEWTKEEEERMQNEAFEWIRVDADFEWICKIHINQPDYMYASQLQQDRDVEAQVDSITYFANSNPSPLYSTILLRTLMDSRYYHGVRLEAAYGMAKFAKEQVDWVGFKHLLEAFKNLFCFPNSTIPRPNDFSDFSNYFIQKAIPLALSTVTQKSGDCPIEIKKFLLNILKYNQNLNNPYSDTFYISHLINCVTSALASGNRIENPNQLDDKSKSFLEDAVAEISRHQKMDEWTSQGDSLVSAVAIRAKLRLARNGLYKFSPEDLLMHTKPSFGYDTRVAAFEALFHLGALKNDGLLKYFFSSLVFDNSLYFKHELIQAFIRSFGHAVLEGISTELDEDELSKPLNVDTEFSKHKSGNGLVVIEDGSKEEFSARKDVVSRATLKGTIELLRRDYSEFEPLKRELWNAVRNPLLSIIDKRSVYDLIAVLIPAYDSLIVKFEIPRAKKIAASKIGKAKVLLKREGVFKISIPKIVTAPPKPIIKPLKISAPKPKTVTPAKSKQYKAEIRRSKTGPLRYVKISKSKKTVTVSSDPLRMSKKGLNKTAPKITLKPISNVKTEPIESPQVVSANPVETPAQNTEPTKPKLKLKFKF